MKKRFSMLVALVMLLTSLIPSFTANAAFSDVDNSHPYKEAIATLSTLKVINGYEDGTFAPDKEISRAEFTKMIVYMLGLGELSTPITTFNDVPQTHWANANIKTAYDLGIINGFDEVTFKPDDPVTYEQALKMVVCTLGYQPYAEQMGGYPNGYREQGSALKLTDKISNLGYTDNAPRGVIAQIMFNALEVEKHENVNGTWKASGKTLLNDYLNVEGLKGVLVGVEESTTSDCDAVLAPGKMAVQDSFDQTKEHIIDFAEHDITVSELIDNLGRTVQVYYRKDKLSNDKWLVEISSEIHKNSEVTINSSEIQEFTGNTVKYRKTGESKAQTARLDLSNLSIRYNGRAVADTDTFNGTSFPAALNDLLDPTSTDFIYGTVRLVSNDTKEVYSMVDIYDYDVIVAQRALQTTDYRINDKTVASNYITLDPDSLSYTFTLTRNDKEVEPTKIAANDVIVYAESLDGTFRTVKASSNSVSGKIDSLNTTKQTLTINGKTYNYSDYFETYLTTKENRTLQSGLQIKAYTDAFGTVQWGTITSTESYYPYAYVIDVIPGDAEEYYLRLFAPSSTSVKTLTSSTTYKVKSFKIADNVKLNGVKRTPAAIDSALAASKYVPDSGATTTEYNQFIRVGFNASGEIDNVITMTTPIDDNGDFKPTENSNAEQLVIYSPLAADGSKYTVTTNAVKSGSTTLYSIKSSTPLFVIPSDRTDTDAYAVKNTISSSSITAGTSHFVEAYDVNTSKYPTFMAIYGSAIQKGTPITVDTKYSLLTNDIYEEVDTEIDEVVEKIPTLTQSAEVSNKTISDTTLKDFSLLGKGDIVLFGYDSDGFANDYTIALDYDDVAAVLNANESTYSWEGADFSFNGPVSGSKHTDAEVYNVKQVLADENKLYVVKNIASENYETITLNSNTKFVRYDEDSDEFTPYVAETSTALTINDLLDIENYGTACSKIAIVSYTLEGSGTTINFIVIYE